MRNVLAQHALTWTRVLGWCAASLMVGSGISGGSEDVARTNRSVLGDARRRPLSLLMDEYHHFPRPADFSQGFSLNGDDFARTYFYATDATGHPNGLFDFSQIVARDFRVKTSNDPIGPALGKRADAYMIICPETAAAGNPHPLTAADAEHLERFVASGGILILVHNSVPEPKEGQAKQPVETFDRRGMNLIARNFGLEFLARTTRTLLIPIPRDHPVFLGAKGIIYGNGTTIAVHPKPGVESTVLIQSNNPDVPGAVAVRARYGRGTVLALGDAGTLGNGHAGRPEIGQVAAIAQLFHCLLPDGPLPAYGWKAGTKMKVGLRHELALTAYPEGFRCLELPRDPAAQTLMRLPRALDLGSAPRGEGVAVPDPAPAPDPAKRRFVASRASWELDAQLELATYDGRAFVARWTGPSASVLGCRLTPRGEIMDPSPAPGALDSWRWALLNEVIVGPLDAQAQPGDEWTSPVMTPLPNAQLRPVPVIREAVGHFCLEGPETCRGRTCLVVKKTVVLPLDEIKPQDLVAPEYSANFDPMAVSVLTGRHTCVARTWVDQTTRLPVRTVLRASTVVWLKDRSQDDRFISDHDWLIHEFRTDERRVLTMGRVLVADFD